MCFMASCIDNLGNQGLERTQALATGMFARRPAEDLNQNSKFEITY